MILLTLVGAWAYVLVPMFLRRHDRLSTNRSADIPAAPTRVLRRRLPAAAPAVRPATTTYPERAAAGVAAGVAVAQLGIGLTVGRRRTVDAVGAGRRRLSGVALAVRTQLRARVSARAGAPTRAQVLARRRRTLAGLAALVVAAIGVELIVSPLAWGAVVLAILAAAGYVGHLRRLTRQAAAARRATRVQLAARRRAIPVTEWIYAVPSTPSVPRPRTGPISVSILAEPAVAVDSRWELESAVS